MASGLLLFTRVLFQVGGLIVAHIAYHGYTCRLVATSVLFTLALVVVDPVQTDLPPRYLGELLTRAVGSEGCGTARSTNALVAG
jgi:hypothetical protein